MSEQEAPAHVPGRGVDSGMDSEIEAAILREAERLNHEFDVQIDEGTFGSHLRWLRRDHSLTQRDLAERAGMDFAALSKVENDRLPPPDEDTVRRLAQVLGVPPLALLSYARRPFEPKPALNLSDSAFVCARPATPQEQP